MEDHFVWMTTRRIRPGTLQEFRRAWRPDPSPEGLHNAYAYWSEDEQEVIGVSFWDSAEAAGNEPARWRESIHALDNLTGWVEVHIEQGRVLQDTATRLGIVEAIVGYIHGDRRRRLDSRRRRIRPAHSGRGLEPGRHRCVHGALLEIGRFDV